MLLKVIHKDCQTLDIISQMLKKKLQYHNGENFFDQPIKNKKITYDNIRKIATGYGHGYTTGYLLDYPYFIKTYKMIAVDLSKQKALHFDPKAIQQINFTAN